MYCLLEVQMLLSSHKVVKSAEHLPTTRDLYGVYAISNEQETLHTPVSIFSKQLIQLQIQYQLSNVLPCFLVIRSQQSSSLC